MRLCFAFSIQRVEYHKERWLLRNHVDRIHVISLNIIIQIMPVSEGNFESSRILHDFCFFSLQMVKTFPFLLKFVYGTVFSVWSFFVFIYGFFLLWLLGIFISFSFSSSNYQQGCWSMKIDACWFRIASYISILYVAFDVNHTYLFIREIFVSKIFGILDSELLFIALKFDL